MGIPWVNSKAENASRTSHCQLQASLWLDRLISTVLPRHCLNCDQPAPKLLCKACLEQLPRNSHACSSCALPLAAGVSGRCGQCLQQTPAVDVCWAPWLYREPLAGLLRRLKFGPELNLAPALGQALAAQTLILPDWLRGIDIIVPAPLHPRRLRQRGFNQSLELIRPCARVHQIPIRSRALRRVRDTPEQSSLSLVARRRNLRGAFAADRDQIEGRSILLFDDVITSGATLRTMAQCLANNGARRIVAVALARTP